MTPAVGAMTPAVGAMSPVIGGGTPVFIIGSDTSGIHGIGGFTLVAGATLQVRYSRRDQCKLILRF